MHKNLKSTILVVIGLLVIAGLSGVAVYRWQHRPVTPNEVAAANQRTVLAEAQLASTTSKDQTALAAQSGSITTLTSQKATLCTQIKAAKLPQPLCP